MGAAALSAVLFASAHLRLATFAPLLLLGLVFAFVYQRTHNLLPPILLHSGWNLYVIYNLLYRQDPGLWAAAVTAATGAG
jgi:membrane protease YdiL (CAAX protease family)